MELASRGALQRERRAEQAGSGALAARWALGIAAVASKRAAVLAALLVHALPPARPCRLFPAPRAARCCPTAQVAHAASADPPPAWPPRHSAPSLALVAQRPRAIGGLSCSFDLRNITPSASPGRSQRAWSLCLSPWRRRPPSSVMLATARAVCFAGCDALLLAPARRAKAAPARKGQLLPRPAAHLAPPSEESIAIVFGRRVRCAVRQVHAGHAILVCEMTPSPKKVAHQPPPLQNANLLPRVALKAMFGSRTRPGINQLSGQLLSASIGETRTPDWQTASPRPSTPSLRLGFSQKLPRESSFHALTTSVGAPAYLSTPSMIFDGSIVPKQIIEGVSITLCPEQGSPPPAHQKKGY